MRQAVGRPYLRPLELRGDRVLGGRGWRVQSEHLLDRATARPVRIAAIPPTADDDSALSKIQRSMTAVTIGTR